MDSAPDSLHDAEEQRVLFAALDSFRQYRRAAHFNITHLRRQSFLALPAAQVELLSQPPFSLPQTLSAVDQAIDSNAGISEAILASGLPAFGVDSQSDAFKGAAKPGDLDKARSTIRQLYRDWSREGSAERHASYFPILTALEREFGGIAASERHHFRILIPGAGLGRLVLEVCAAGYTVEGNEISYHQLLASYYMLNCVASAHAHQLYPWALGFSNHVSRANQLSCVAVPDIHPAAALQAADDLMSAKVPYGERMSMTSGDFCALYRQPEYHGAFDAITTCFFIDTAPNVLNYMQTALHCLKDGGIWVNLGPLLWHFESSPTPAERAKHLRTQAPLPQPIDTSHSTHQGIGECGAFELSHDEVIALIQHCGFELLDLETSPAGATGYIQDPQSMLQNVYRPMLWTARKPR